MERNTKTKTTTKKTFTRSCNLNVFDKLALNAETLLQVSVLHNKQLIKSKY